MTEGNRRPRSYVFGQGPLIVRDAFEHMALQTQVIAWITGFLPALINTMEVGTDMMARYATKG
jgi:hypothetical protein